LKDVEQHMRIEAKISINGIELTETEARSVGVAVYVLSCALAEDDNLELTLWP
jgi:hypothetical protein